MFRIGIGLLVNVSTAAHDEGARGPALTLVLNFSFTRFGMELSAYAK